ncbi:MAG: hypothetical protein ACO1RX_14355 [Candidatus Sericytochromatia bacterium]
MLKPVLVSLCALTLLSSCNNAEMEALKTANQQLAADKIRLEAELSAAKTELASYKTQNQQMGQEKFVAQLTNSMESLQKQLEIYAVDHEGNYPPTLADFWQAAAGMEYFVTITNPVTGASWTHDKHDANGIVEWGAVSAACKPGALYLQVPADQTRYTLSACTDNGQPLKKHNAVYSLSPA